MTKKSFKDNPALQFISSISAEQELEQVQEAERITESRTAPAPEGYKLNPLYVEKKSRRLQLVLQPSLYEKVKAASKDKGMSVNDYIHKLLEEATKEE